ncbi:MAG: thioredoxin family protein [Candidatus Eiseniibacteriota bacterium]
MRKVFTQSGIAAVCVMLAGGVAHGKDPVKDAVEASKEKAELKLVQVGEAAPDFTLTDLEGKEHHLADYRGKVVVLEWFNPDCPFVKKHHEKNKTMATTSAEFHDKGVVWLAVNSGAPGKQGHGLDRNKKAAEDYGIAYPILLDESGTVGRLYEAKTTPHMYVIDAAGTLVYRGAIDDNPSPGTLGETNYVSKCVAELLAGGNPKAKETKSYGCSVKYSSPEASLP